MQSAYARIGTGPICQIDSLGLGNEANSLLVSTAERLAHHTIGPVRAGRLLLHFDRMGTFGDETFQIRDRNHRGTWVTIKVLEYPMHRYQHAFVLSGRPDFASKVKSNVLLYS